MVSWFYLENRSMLNGLCCEYPALISNKQLDMWLTNVKTHTKILYLHLQGVHYTFFPVCKCHNCQISDDLALSNAFAFHFNLRNTQIT